MPGVVMQPATTTTTASNGEKDNREDNQAGCGEVDIRVLPGSRTICSNRTRCRVPHLAHPRGRALQFPCLGPGSDCEQAQRVSVTRMGKSYKDPRAIDVASLPHRGHNGCSQTGARLHDGARFL